MPTSDAHASLVAKPRKGISTPALLVTVGIAALLAIAALDLAQLSHQRYQIQRGADSAALAATAQLHDKRWLYLGPGDPATEDVEAKLPSLDWVIAGQLASAETSAEDYAMKNHVAHLPIRVDASDMTMGYIAEPADRAFADTPLLHEGVNSLQVKASRRKSAGNLPLLWMASQVGLDDFEMKINSQAVVDQRVYGFRPIVARDANGEPTGTTRIPVPIVPFAVIPDNEDLQMDVPADYPTNLWWAKGPHDDVSVVPEQRLVTPGTSDLIAEFVIRIHCGGCSGTPDNSINTRDGALVDFDGSGTGAAAMLQVSRYGLYAEDLAPYGEINMYDPNNLSIYAAGFEISDQELAAIQAGLLNNDISKPDLIGAPRIFPVGVPLSTTDGGSGGSPFPGGGATKGIFPGGGATGGVFPGGYGSQGNFAIVGFVAGTIVDCTRDSDGSLLLVVQPCVLQTPTALVAGVVNNDVIPRNPWIGKLLLNR